MNLGFQLRLQSRNVKKYKYHLELSYKHREIFCLTDRHMAQCKAGVQILTLHHEFGT